MNTPSNKGCYEFLHYRFICILVKECCKCFFVSFSLFSFSQAIRRTIDRKMMDVFTLFSTKLSVVNEVLCRISSLTPAQMPQHAGQAHWARALRTQIERPMEVRFCVYFNPVVFTQNRICDFITSP